MTKSEKIQEMNLRSLSIQKVLETAGNKWPKRNFVYEKKHGEYVPKTFAEFTQDSKNLAEFLLSKKLGGQQIAILGDNSYNFMVADMAVMGYVGVSVTLNSMWGVKDCQRAMKILDAKVFFYDNRHQNIARELKKIYPKIEFIKLEDIAEIAKGFNAEPKIAETDTTKLSKIIFSSGTTSVPKAVMLSQKNMFAGINSLLRRTGFTTSEITYLFMPLCHVFGGICSFLYSLVGGCPIYLSSGKEHILEELKEIKPTAFSVVPLMLEIIYAGIDDQTKAKAKKAMKLSNFLLLFKIDIRRKLFKKLHEGFGGELKYLFCSGAKLDNEIKQFFKDAGVNLLEAYASTETAASLALEYPSSKKLDSAGTIYEDIDVKIDSPNAAGIGEILVRGDSVCLGYYKNDKANEQAFDRDGYFRMGDLGFMDQSRGIFLHGRKKRTILLSNGVNVYPDEIERDLEGGCVRKVKVYEDKQKIVAEFYVTTGTKASKIKKLVAKYNEKSLEYWKIDDYEIVEYNEKSHLK
ncbi:MAG: AMP-binding protein [Candidatus Nomurabacteria bacterium]|jgi:long-subunit acyl-CoA synthetase (AMP-forming)|nr:AMP-binding protein [Candidatus Nomurabacteria bacterium]